MPNQKPKAYGRFVSWYDAAIRCWASMCLVSSFGCSDKAVIQPLPRLHMFAALHGCPARRYTRSTSHLPCTMDWIKQAICRPLYRYRAYSAAAYFVPLSAGSCTSLTSS